MKKGQALRASLVINILFLLCQTVNGQAKGEGELEQELLASMIEDWRSKDVKYDIGKRVNKTDWSYLLVDSALNEKIFISPENVETYSFLNIISKKDVEHLKREIKESILAKERWPRSIHKVKLTQKKPNWGPVYISMPIFNESRDVAFVCIETNSSESLSVYKLIEGKWIESLSFSLWIE